MFILTLFATAFIPMLLEARRSVKNERALRAVGAVEPSGDVYAAMQVIYPGCFLAMLLESWVQRRTVTAIALAGALVFAAAKTLKYWAIAALGNRWTFRVLVPPGSQPTERGPYRWLRHPNYIAVAGELAGFAMLAQAPVTGTLSLLIFGLLMAARIRIEERALGLR
jgi:methyltransferase